MTPPLEGIKLAAWDEARPRKTVVEVGGARIGDAFSLFVSLEGAGDENAALAAARAVKDAGASLLRWPDGEAEGFARAHGMAARAGLPVIVEVTDTKEVVPAAAAADVLMVGAANMQNFSLLKELGRSARKPVLLVRGWHATLKEWLNSAEYVLFEGNPGVILCDAGIRGFEAGSRVILDVSAIAAVKGISHLPIVLDVGRAGGPEEIEKLGLASIAAGVDGLMLEVGLDAGRSGAAAPAAGLDVAAFAGLARKFAAMSRLVEGLARDHD